MVHLGVDDSHSTPGLARLLHDYYRAKAGTIHVRKGLLFGTWLNELWHIPLTSPSVELGT